MNNIPKVNLEDFTSINSKTKKLFVKKIGVAFQEIGFLVLKGHFLSTSLQENLFKEIRDFFNLSEYFCLSLNFSGSDLIDGVSMLESTDEITGFSTSVVLDW